MKYAWKPDVPDARDRYFKPRLSAAKSLPKFVNKLGTSNRIEDQGSLNSCTGNSSTSALEIALGWTQQLSRLMAYYNGRDLEGLAKQDEGAYIRLVMKGLTKRGVSVETLWPYVEKKVLTKPNKKAQDNALSVLKVIQEAGVEYARVTSLKDLKAALADGWPVVFGFSVPPAFENLPKSGLLKLPGKNTESLGGHAVVAVGYDDRPKEPFIWVRNSWGPDWALGGYFKMTQNWFTDKRRLVDDLWVVRKTK